MSDSVTFDRAVAYYDRTRALTPATEAAMAEVVGEELRGRGPVLEIGVGTGRIALPLRQAGVDLFGVDLSVEMLEKLRSKGAAPVVRGDATELPFRDATFGAAVAVHVLHLIPAWKQAVDELLRVVRPGGVLLVSQGSWSSIYFEDVLDAFADAAHMELRHIGLNDQADLDRALEGAGVTARDLTRIEDVRTGTLREMVDSLGEGLFSFTWGLDEEARRAAAAATAEYAKEAYGSLDEPRDIPTEMYWRAYDLA